MEPNSLNEALRKIPSVEHLLQSPAISGMADLTSRGFVVSIIQKFLGELRDSIRSGSEGVEMASDHNLLLSKLVAAIQERLRPSLRSVVNATGVIIHTNLGRAPLSSRAQKSLSALGACYTNLEYDLRAGERSHRDKILESILVELLGCEAATVVNNNAAALLLALNSLASGREVVVSRGELVEIGGSFRIPEIMARSGAILREIGTTNKTRIQDYAAAIGPQTALLLRVHQSNFRIRGFTHRPPLEEIVGVARAGGVPLLDDIGSGCLVDLRAYGISDEPVAQKSLAAGADLVCFSGDKLLGGPQAGILAGAERYIRMVRENPLMRTYRVGKLIAGALEATLAGYRNGRALEEIPVLGMISIPFDELQSRSSQFMDKLGLKLPEGATAQPARGESVVGGGSCPDFGLASPLIALRSDRVTAAQIESRLRSQEPPVIIRIEEDTVLIDLRTVFSPQEDALLQGLVDALRSG